MPVNPCAAGGARPGSPRGYWRRVGGRTGRYDRCRWRGTCQLRGLRRGGLRRDVGQDPGEGAPWGVRGLHCVCSICSSRRDGMRVCEQCRQCTLCTAQRFHPPPGASASSPRWTRWTLRGAPCPSHGCRSLPAGEGGWRYRRAPGWVDGAVAVTSPGGSHPAPLTRL